jgi:hypothetical protein
MAVYLLTFSGTLMSGSEQFSHTLAVDDTGSSSDTAVLAAGVSALNAMVGTSGFLALYPTTTKWTNVKCALVTNLSSGTLFAGVNTAVNHTGTGASAATHLPPQLAIAVSLVAGPKPNGTPYRGRFYLPCPTAGASGISEHLLTTTGRTTLLNGVEALMDGLTDATEGRSPQVWSRKDGLTSTVRSIRIGRAVDTIRSRRRDIPETYETRAL